MKTWQKLLSLFLCAVLACGAFALQARAEDTAVYVSASGDDATGDGSEANPYATLAKAVTEAPDGATVYVASDLVMTSCARFYNKNLTISSVPGAVYTVTRGEGFATQSDNARSWYNPAMIEVGGTKIDGSEELGQASLRLENIVFDDAGRYEGTKFGFAKTDGTGGNLVYVQDAIVASYNGTGTVTLGAGAVLKNYGGMSAVHLTGACTLIMESGSVICDDGAIANPRNGRHAVNLIGAAFEMREGATIRDMRSLVLNAEGASVVIGGTVSGNSGVGNPLLRIVGSSSLTIDATGVITGNTTNSIGTIYVQNGSNAYIYGTISNNSAPAGALFVVTNGQDSHAALYDGAKITGNMSTSKYGVIEVQQGKCSFTMYGGTISGNTAKAGAIQLRKGNAKFVMNGGVIENNALLEGGTGDPGVFMTEGANLTAELNTGTLQSITVNTDVFGKIANGHVRIAEGFVLQSGCVSMRQDAKTLAPESLDIRLGNACRASVSALTADAAAKGWNTVLATFWTQRNNPAALTVGGLTIDESLPVYAILIPTGEDGNPAADAQAVILRAPAGGGEIALTVPASENGYAVALVQPDADYGTVTISGPESVRYTGEPVEVTYTVTYTLSESLKNRLEAGESLTGLTIVLQPDARLDAPETGLTVTGLTVDASNTTAQAGFRCTLLAESFETGKTLLTGGYASFALNGDAVLVPGNTVTTEMKDRPTFSVRYAWTGAPEGKYAPVLPESVFGLTEGAVHVVDRTYFAGYTIVEKDEYGNVTGEWVFSGWSRRGRITVTEDVLITGAWTYRKAEAVPDPVIPTGSAALTKTGAAGERLSGAVFALYRVGERDEYAGTYTTDRTGEIRIDGLFEGRYCFIETRAPEGYVTDGVRHEFTVTAGQTARLTVENRRETLYGAFSTEHMAYIVGYEDGCVRPEADITRAEVATIFFRLLDDRVRKENMTAENAFADVGAGDWYNTAVSTMAAMGVVGGYPDGTFRPGEPITRAEFAAMAARFLSGDAAQGSAFADVQGHWAQREIGMAAAKGWVQGYEDGTFRPDRPITRAEAMTMINRVLERNPASAEDLHDGMIVWKDNADTGKWYYLAVQEATNSHTYARRAGGSEFWLALCTNRDWTSLEK
ncbi:MAG: S-layer homology domain-containing protein [Eubacteriales bacterium]|nr:S-layer homology domain-containing protein [Eubacteriales bacterium]